MNTEDRISRVERKLETLSAQMKEILGEARSAEYRPEYREEATPSNKYAAFLGLAPSAPAARSPYGMSHLLAVVAVLCFVLAACFVVKLAVESGWLDRERQWALLVLFGF